MPNSRFFDDDFPQRPSGVAPDQHPLSEWGMLARGKTLGKSANIFYVPPTSAGAPVNAPVNMFEVKGEDEYAMPLQVNLLPPQYYDPSGTTDADNIQNASGSVGNIQGLTDAQHVSFANPIAIIEWGIGGITTQVVADILNGLCVNINASWVRIQGAIERPASISTTSMGYHVSAFLGPGMPKPINAQRTVYIAGLGDGIESSVIAIPAYAKRVSLLGSPAAAGLFAGQIDFWRDNLGSASTFPNGRLFFSGNNPGPLTIPNGSYYFSVTNLTGQTVAPAIAVFELAV